MKKSTILGLATCTFLLNTLNALAVTDDKYPAANFEPKVTYLDESAVKQSPSSHASIVDEKYPASSFEPKVIFSAESGTTTSAISQETVDQVDPKFPAAYFKPRIIYP